MPLPRLALAAALLASAFVHAFTADAVTPSAKTELFNGKDLTGWKHVGGGSRFVENGLLASKGGMGL